MRTTAAHELPDDLRPVLARARRLEVWTIAYLVSVIVLLGLVMGSSQAMRTAWVEDVLSLVPPIAFLVAERVRRRPITTAYPYGFHRAVTVAFLISSFAILLFGTLLLADGARHLVTGERPAIGGMELFGTVVWQGWPMLAVLVWAIVPAVILGRLKLEPARRLHDKALYADATMNKADWLSGVAAAFGVAGVGLGWWWADAVGALVISLDIVKDGWTNLRHAIGDLMDRRPLTVERDRPSSIPDQVRDAVGALPWVAEVEVRFREHGHVFFGELYLVPRGDTDLFDRAEEARRTAVDVDWRVHDVVVSFRRSDSR